MKTEQVLPSAFQIGEKIGLQMLIDMMERARDGFVNGVCFDNGKVKYNIHIPKIDGDLPEGENVIGYFRVANVDSAYVIKPFENDLHYNSWRDIAYRTRQQLWNELEKWNSMDVTPDREEDHDKEPNQEYSKYMLLDLNGDGDFLRTAYYDYEHKEWELTTSEEITPQSRWRRLTLA